MMDNFKRDARNSRLICVYGALGPHGQSNRVQAPQRSTEMPFRWLGPPIGGARRNTMSYTALRETSLFPISYNANYTNC